MKTCLVNSRATRRSSIVFVFQYSFASEGVWAVTTETAVRSMRISSMSATFHFTSSYRDYMRRRFPRLGAPARIKWNHDFRETCPLARGCCGDRSAGVCVGADGLLACVWGRHGGHLGVRGLPSLPVQERHGDVFAAMSEVRHRTKRQCPLVRILRRLQLDPPRLKQYAPSLFHTSFAVPRRSARQCTAGDKRADFTHYCLSRSW